MMKRIDSHHHLWNLKDVHYPWLMEFGKPRFFGDPTPIQRDYLLAEHRAISHNHGFCLLYTSPSPRDLSTSRMPSSA